MLYVVTSGLTRSRYLYLIINDTKSRVPCLSITQQASWSTQTTSYSHSFRGKLGNKKQGSKRLVTTIRIQESCCARVFSNRILLFVHFLRTTRPTTRTKNNNARRMQYNKWHYLCPRTIQVQWLLYKSERANTTHNNEL